ncbi:MAG: ABC transporter ATP-binding protein/permease [Clostridia bacterium]|nr:ABC transporter ATP-binding protein/permease [Clostridia bacterium]
MFGKLFKCLREYKKYAILTPVAVGLEVVLECIIPFLTAELVGNIENGCGMDVIVKYGVILLVMALASLLFGAIAGKTCAVATAGFAKNLRKDIFYRIQGFSFENIDKFSTSSLVTRLTTDVQFASMAFSMIIRVAVRSPFMLVFAFVMAFVMGGSLAWMFAAVVPFLGFGLFLIIKIVMPIFKNVFKKYDALNESVQENVKAIRVVKSFVREDYEKKKFEEASENVRADFTRAERILAFNNPLMQVCLHINMIFVMTYGSWVVVSSAGLDLQVAQLSALLTYSFMILNSLMMISMIFVMITISIESCRRCVEVLDEESTILSPENGAKDIADGSIEFKDVMFRYPGNNKVDALDNINLSIPSGATVGIIGSTGSSKSTLIQLICRLYDVSGGEVKVGGLNVKDYDLETLRNGVAVVLQKNILFSGTIKENLRWGNPDATDGELEEAAALACADEFINQFPEGYDTYIEQGGVNVSGGQKQRLCIARALLKKPKILILDDSTSAVDTRTDAKIRKAMREYIPSTTKIIIAQRTASVEDADFIVVMDNGRIDAVGSHKQLMENNAIYRDIYISQNKAGADDE